MECCLPLDADQQDAWNACEMMISEAIETQCTDGNAPPVLVDALPTLGKTTAAAKLAPQLCTSEIGAGMTYLTHLIRNRDEFQAELEDHPAAESLTVKQLPRFVETCPTASGEYGDGKKSELLELYNRGIAPGVLHSHQSLNLPCGGNDCPYMRAWRTLESADILIGHPTHAYVNEAVADRIVVIDEGPGDAFETTFDSDQWHSALRNYITNQSDLPINSVNELKQARYNGGTTIREEVLADLQAMDRREYQREIIEQTQAHADIGYAIRLFLRDDDSIREAGTAPYKRTLSNGVEFARLESNVVGVYDPETGKITVRRTPEFRPAKALVGLDGTPLTALWQGRLGLDKLDVEQVLCRDCRQRYIEEILGYELVQTSLYTKPYSALSGKQPSYDKDRGLLHEVCRHTDGRVGLITTKGALDALFEYDDTNEIPIDADEETNWYGNLRSSNRFAGTDINVGVVIGSRHPGSDLLRQLAGLDGVAYQSNSREVTKQGHTFHETVPTEGGEYLFQFREQSVAQAILRFGREDGATVYIHTEAIPSWLQDLASTELVERRSTGEQAVLRTLERLEEATTTKFVEEIEVIGRSQIRKLLNALHAEGIVTKGGSQHRTVWKTNHPNVSRTAKIEILEPATDD
jgi:hypothetical protein